MREALRAVVKAEWGMASKFISDLFTSPESVMNGDQFAEYQEISANHDDARKILDAALEIDVRPLLSQITAPTLVIHHRDDRIIPIENGQEIAAGIKGARFLSFPGTHIATVKDFAEAFTAIFEFVGAGADGKRAKSPSQDSSFRTVLFTDLVGHTDMMRRLGDEKGRAVLREHEQLTRDVLKANGGTEVKTMGDGFMASFGSVTKAVECAIALQRAFAEREGEPLSVRVGLNAGEPIEEDGDLFGATVILASRIATKAGAGEVLVSDNVRSLCSGKGFLFADRGEFVAKGFEEPMRVYEVSWRG
jgi:class 3 adenylate cyclase